MVYVDNPELQKIGVVRLETAPGSGRALKEVILKFNFGDEVTVEASDPVSGNKAKGKVSIEFTS